MYICLEANDAFFGGGHYIRQRDTRSKVDGAGSCKRNVVLSILFPTRADPLFVYVGGKISSRIMAF